MIRTKGDIIQVIKKDEYMMEVLETTEKLGLNDYWICAGFVRNKVWDVIFNVRSRTLYNDVDVVYFDAQDIRSESEKEFESYLKNWMPDTPFEVVNQARIYHNHPGIDVRCAEDGIKHFPETPTAVGVRLKHGQLELTAPHGIYDLVNGIVQPTPYFGQAKHIGTYHDRIKSKNWQHLWPDLTINK